MSLNRATNFSRLLDSEKSNYQGIYDDDNLAIDADLSAGPAIMPNPTITGPVEQPPKVSNLS